jgi:hypothetical protein
MIHLKQTTTILCTNLFCSHGNDCRKTAVEVMARTLADEL